MSFVTYIVHPLIKQIDLLCKITHFGKSLSDECDLRYCYSNP